MSIFVALVTHFSFLRKHLSFDKVLAKNWYFTLCFQNTKNNHTRKSKKLAKNMETQREEDKKRFQRHAFSTLRA
jgi:hypothetical protein